ncbi:hypothetical protein ACFX13_045407 [Malus domestica]
MEAQEVEAQAATGSGQQQLKLYSYWMSSCSFRVRIALNLKGLKYEYKALAKGEQFSPEFRKLNPMGYVPVLVDGDTVVADSFAIILYLEEKYPQHPLLPPDLQKKAINYQNSIDVYVVAYTHDVDQLLYRDYEEWKISFTCIGAYYIVFKTLSDANSTKEKSMI